MIYTFLSYIFGDLYVLLDISSAAIISIVFFIWDQFKERQHIGLYIFNHKK